jgi:hypothetical protein
MLRSLLKPHRVLIKAICRQQRQLFCEAVFNYFACSWHVSAAKPRCVSVDHWKRFSYQPITYIHILSHAYYMLRTFHPP